MPYIQTFVSKSLKWLDLNPSDQPVALNVALGKHGGDRKSKKFQAKDQVRVTKLKSGTMTTDYLLARLARDHPGILSAYERGEFKSVRAATITAGIIKLKSPLDCLRADWRKASQSERVIAQSSLDV